MKSSFILFNILVAGVLAIPTRTDYVLHERRDAIPSHWTGEKRLNGQTVLPMRIGLTQSNLDRGHDLLMEVSTPGSHRYGDHLTVDDVHDLFAPSQESIDSVRSWLESAGIAPDRISQSTNKQWLQFDAGADEVEQLLKTEFYRYSHVGTGRSHVACREYHVPESVQSHIDYITPGIKHLEIREERPIEKRSLDKRSFGILPPILRPLTMPLEELLGQLLALCDVAVTPACIQAMYNVTDGDKATKGNELGIFEDLGDVYSQDDLDLFFSTVAHKIPTGTHPILNAIDGAQAPADTTNAGTESDLDFEISYPLIWPQNSILFQTDDPIYQNNYTYNGFLNNFLDAIDGSYCSETSPLDPPYPNPADGGYKSPRQCGVYKPTNVISISYGGAEADLPIAYQRRQCQEFMKLGLQGVSIVVASGDSGVQGRGGSPTPSGCLGKDNKVFAPDFPATCPYLTTAGGTYLPPGADVHAHEEQATTSFPSGGGFSNIYKRPEYQNAAVEEYFNTAQLSYPYYESVDNSSFAANGGIYNRIGRAYPDVAAIADNVLVFNKGLPTLVGGTSAAAPVFAALLTRINEERLAAGKKTVGFVNPVLYANPEVFFDVTKGSNQGCGTDGFPAAKGWDPVTGLGTPNYPKLLELFMGLD
ncbi:peptidase S8/S53 domain-containing protein [Aspergillus pseudocaelatus]|uniref:Peptidase S8/S53 domain-containing protein n=1 Tax=Aspergillus pseudocaelatus TaxID=1825620 RepID=A0ABQ6WRU6_9EURO|nr:peptidase S8/S53 domain-containing protein [Aspergillus pseudocaelatus]